MKVSSIPSKPTSLEIPQKTPPVPPKKSSTKKPSRRPSKVKDKDKAATKSDQLRHDQKRVEDAQVKFDPLNMLNSSIVDVFTDEIDNLTKLDIGIHCENIGNTFWLSCIIQAITHSSPFVIF